MSRLIARVLLSVFLVPLWLLVYFTGSELLYRPPVDLDYDSGLLGAVLWVVAWRTQVTWNTLRRWGTIACGAVALLSGLTTSWLIEVNDVWSGIVDGLSISLIWLIATTLLWRDTRHEAAVRLCRRPVAPSCPNCGYNMTGLREAPCPACGTPYTPGELLIRQRWRLVRLEQAEIERMLQ
jgi:hypothetical protein